MSAVAAHEGRFNQLGAAGFVHTCTEDEIGCKYAVFVRRVGDTIEGVTHAVETVWRYFDDESPPTQREVHTTYTCRFVDLDGVVTMQVDKKM